MNSDTNAREQLASLRADIDAIDGDVLKLLGKRAEVVTHIAGVKREASIPIRDRQREAELLADRCAQARRLDLPIAEIEALYRLLLLTSRDQQAALRAEVPDDLEPKTVAIIGGQGGMGLCLARLFSSLGNKVLIADLSTDLDSAAAAQQADVVVVSVPIDVTLEVIRHVGPHVRDDALLMDVTSIKSSPVETMLECTSSAVLGTHPMFGPSIHSFQNQRVVFCEGRGKEWSLWARKMFQAAGLVITDAQPEEHDRAMVVVQVLNHFQNEVFGLALARSGVTLNQTLRFTSPAYRMELYMASRHFAQSARLYGQIQMNNPMRKEVIDIFRQAAGELGEVVANQDQPAFDAVFDEVAAYFGPFANEALEQSSFLMDRLVERS